MTTLYPSVALIVLTLASLQSDAIALIPATGDAKPQIDYVGEAELLNRLLNENLSKDLGMALTEITAQKDMSIEVKMRELNELGSVMNESAIRGDSRNQETVAPIQDFTVKSEEFSQNKKSLEKVLSGYQRIRGILGLMRSKLLYIGGYLTRRFNDLGKSTLTDSFKQRLKSGADTMKLRLPKWPDFATFKLKFNKLYTSPREELFRQMVYLRTQSVVLMQHMRCVLRLDRHFLKATTFSDWTEVEYLSKLDNVEAHLEQQSDLGESFSREELDQLKLLATDQKLTFREILDNKVPMIDGDNNNRRQERHRRDTTDMGSDMDEIDKSEEDRNMDRDNSSSLVIENLPNQLKPAETLEQQQGDVDEFDPIDLRSTGCVGPIEDQGSCGACFSYAATAGAEFYQCLAEGEFKSFNSRFPADCGNYYDLHIDGCTGGKISKTLRFIAHSGHYPKLVYELYRTSRVEGYHSDVCPFAEPPGETRAEKIENLKSWARIQVKTLDGATFHTLEFDDWHTYLQTIGPIYINMATPRNFKDWGSGIYDGSPLESDKIGIHSMIIFGHMKDDDEGKSYWLIKNSQGSLWGDQGWMRMSDLGIERQVILSLGMRPKNFAAILASTQKYK